MLAWKYPAAELAQIPVPNALVPVAQAVDAVDVHELPAGQGEHSALPARTEKRVGGAQVVDAISALAQAVPAAQFTQESLSAEVCVPWGHIIVSAVVVGHLYPLGHVVQAVCPGRL